MNILITIAIMIFTVCFVLPTIILLALKIVELSIAIKRIFDDEKK